MSMRVGAIVQLARFCGLVLAAVLVLGAGGAVAPESGRAASAPSNHDCTSAPGGWTCTLTVTRTPAAP